MKFYADEATRKFLETDQRRVFLYGGYDDPNNFGDIIQLKGAILQHEDRERIAVLSYRALKEDGYIEKLKQWFDCQYFVFVTNEKPEMRFDGVEQIKTASKGGLLHVYGGGYLNAMWGDWKVEQITALLTFFEPKAYVMSGLQIDQQIVSSLAELFKAHKPLLVGLRDKESLGYLTNANLGVPIHYSFDDVSEVFSAWSSAALDKKRAVIHRYLQRPKFAIHLNTASYTGAADEHIGDINHAIGLAREKHSSYSPIALHSFNERRPGFTIDTLGSIVNLQEDFPYHSYGVVNLAQMALDIRPHEGYYPDVVNLLSNVRFAIACSYHTALLMSFLKKPVYLIASNDFYRQKREALGYTEDIEAFLDSPGSYINSFDADLRDRAAWLELFETQTADL